MNAVRSCEAAELSRNSCISRREVLKDLFRWLNLTSHCYWDGIHCQALMYLYPQYGVIELTGSIGEMDAASLCDHVHLQSDNDLKL
jgi:hypothetical protein